MTAIDTKEDSLVTFHASHTVEARATLTSVTNYTATFEIYSSLPSLRTSEVLEDFKVFVQGFLVYSGRAVVTNLLNVGTVTYGEVKLEPEGFRTQSIVPGEANGHEASQFSDFLRHWQKVYKVRPEFKVVVADMQTFLTDLRIWLDRVELEIRSLPAGDRMEAEKEAAHRVGEEMVPAFDSMHERLERMCDAIEDEIRPVHQSFSKRQLHPLMLCSPFAYRTYHKPLGYAGDYEMVNMITRDPYEGASLFAKVVNLWFLRQWPARAHRNRIQYLRQMLRQESVRGAIRGRPIRVLNLGCGPAREIQEFLEEEPVSDHAQFTLLDFNDETVAYTERILRDLKGRHGRRTQIQVLKRSVQHMLKEAGRPVVPGSDREYDVVYCAGLFDYLPNRACKQLMSVFYDMTAPGGLVVATNVDACKPFRHMLEFVLDWHLIYRDGAKGAALVPERASREDATIRNDETGVNVFIEVRKAGHG